MAIDLQQDDFAQLRDLVMTLPEFRTVYDRVSFVDEMFAGSPRKDDLVSSLNLDGRPRAVAVQLIDKLARFGQDVPGQESLAHLINLLISYSGGGEEQDYLKGLFHRYPLKGNPIAKRNLTDWQGRDNTADVQEKVIGENTLRHIRLLELALTAAQSVMRIDANGELGSGFVVGNNLIMTNNHVIDTQIKANESLFEFHYELNKEGRPRSTTRIHNNPDGLFYTNPFLDFTVVEVENLPAGISPLTLARKRVKTDQRVNIIQHPSGSYKRISMQNNFIAFANATILQYLTTTQPGSSGSPVFNNDFVVVGIHHSGGEIPDPETQIRYLRNAGSSMIAVLNDLQQNAPDVYQQLTIQS